MTATAGSSRQADAARSVKAPAPAHGPKQLPTAPRPRGGRSEEAGLCGAVFILAGCRDRGPRCLDAPFHPVLCPTSVFHGETGRAKPGRSGPVTFKLLKNFFPPLRQGEESSSWVPPASKYVGHPRRTRETGHLDTGTRISHTPACCFGGPNTQVDAPGGGQGVGAELWVCSRKLNARGSSLPKSATDTTSNDASQTGNKTPQSL